MLCIREEDTIRLIIEFLSNRELCITQLNLERETGIYNCDFNDDLIFLRQLILDGQWNDVLEFVSPLESFESFSTKRFHFIIYKHKYIELLCIRSEAGQPYQTTIEIAIPEIIDCLDRLNRYCSNDNDRSEYNHLNSLLTIPNLQDDNELKNWNPNSWRLKCFNDILPLVERFMQSTSTASNDDGNLGKSNGQQQQQIAKNDRLMDLIFKGLLYELCLNTVMKRLQQQQQSETFEPNIFNGITHHGDNNQWKWLNLNQFFGKIPIEYLHQMIDSDDGDGRHSKIENHNHCSIAKHEKPELIASWSEMIFSAPIKPKIFPHIDVPYTRLKATDLMSKSLTASLMHHSNTKDLMTMSVCDIARFTRSTLLETGFHLKKFSNKQPINTIEQPSKTIDTESMIRSIDRLFQDNKHHHKDLPLKIKTLKHDDDDDNNGYYDQNHQMATISEKATPIDDQIDLLPLSKAPSTTAVAINLMLNPKGQDDDKTNNDNDNDDDGLMATSYLKIWQKSKLNSSTTAAASVTKKKKIIIENEKGAATTIRNNNQHQQQRFNKNTGIKHSSTTTTLAEKYRKESNKLARSSSAKSTTNKTIMSNVDRNNNSETKQHSTINAKGHMIIVDDDENLKTVNINNNIDDDDDDDKPASLTTTGKLVNKGSKNLNNNHHIEVGETCNT